MVLPSGALLEGAAGLFETQHATLYLSIMVLLYGLLGGAYLFYEWYKHGCNKRPLLYFSLAMIGLYLFEIPTILEYSGIQIVFSRFNSFFALAFPLNFIARVLIASAIFILASPKLYAKWRPYFFGWMLAATVYYVLIFQGQEPLAGRWPIIISISLFYLPLHVLTMALVAYWLGRDKREMGFVSMAGLVLIAIGVVIAIWRCFLVIQALLNYPPHFWFLAYSSGALFATEVVYLLCLLIGFFLVHKRYLHGSEAV